MIWKEYLKLEFKKPKEDDTIINIRNKKKNFEINISKCYSRLETIEICTSNSKNEDALLLAKALLIDIYNLLLEFYSESKVENIDPDFKIGELIKTPNLLEIFISLKNNLDLENLEEDNILKIESSLSESLYKLEKEMRIYLENPIDNYKKRLTTQSIVFFVLLSIGIASFLKNYIERKPLQPDYIGVQISDDKSTAPTDPEVNIPTQGEEGWDIKKVNLSTPKTIEKLFISPLHQNKGRFQFKDLKIYDDKNFILYEKSFIIDNTDLTELLKILKTEEIFPGKIVIGRALEMESIGKNPKMIIYFDKKIDKVAQIEFKYRATKRTNKYQD
jgi:hypothetical protein